MDIDFRRNDEAAKSLNAEKRAETHFWAMPILSVIFLISLLLIGDYYVRWNGYALIIFNIVLLFGMNLVVFYSYQLVAKSCENRQREELLYQHYLKLEESYQASRKIVHDLKKSHAGNYRAL